jgi:hypothetical protein
MPSLEDRGKAIAEAFLGETGRIIECRAVGATGALTEERRAELLAKAVAREAVEIELDILAYEQKPGQRNLNCFRFRDGGMIALGASGVGTPFLRDHNRWSVDAIGGTIIASKTTKRGDGDYVINQTVRLTEPAAVERALRGNLRAVSIGAMPTGPVLCSHCGTPIFEECWHYRGDEIEAEDGSTEVIEWIYTSAVLVESSEVPIGAVPSAGVQTIRAALAAAGYGTGNRGRVPHEDEEKTMKKTPALVAKLQLAGLLAACANPAEPTDAEFEAAVEELLGDRAELTITRHETTATAQSAEEKFVRGLLDTGRILAADADVWRASFRASPERAQALAAKRPANCATPVGAARQSAQAEPTNEQVKAATTAAAAGTTVEAMSRDTQAQKVLEQHSVPYADAVRYARMFGATDPKAAVAKHCAGVEG